MLTVRMNEKTYIELAAVALLRGQTMSGLVQYFAHQVIREEKVRDPIDFARAVGNAQKEIEQNKQARKGKRTAVSKNNEAVAPDPQPDSMPPFPEQPPLVSDVHMSNPKGEPTTGRLSREAKSDILRAKEATREKRRREREQKGG